MAENVKKDKEPTRNYPDFHHIGRPLFSWFAIIATTNLILFLFLSAFSIFEVSNLNAQNNVEILKIEKNFGLITMLQLQSAKIRSHINYILHSHSQHPTKKIVNQTDSIFKNGELKELTDQFNSNLKLISAANEQNPHIINSVTKIELDLKKAMGSSGIKNLAEFEASLEKQIRNILTEIEGQTKLKITSNAKTFNIVIALLTLLGILFSITFYFTITRKIKNEFNHVVRKIKSSSENNFLSAKSIKSIIDKTISNSSSQASSIQETAATLNEITAIVNKNTEYAESSNEHAVSSQKIASEGQKVVLEMIEAIQDISISNRDIMSAVDKSNKEISDVTQLIHKISEKTKVIHDIVFQTKLLSFNASVEAARAGEHGRGFSVVSQEISNLSQLSGKAAKEISTMLTESTRTVDHIVEEGRSRVKGLMEINNRKVTYGVDIAKRCGEVLKEVVNNTSQVSNMISQINLASREQAQGVGHISEAMNLIDQTINNNLNNIQVSSKSVHSLLEDAQTLEQLTKSLNVLIFGDSAEGKLNKDKPHENEEISFKRVAS